MINNIKYLFLISMILVSSCDESGTITGSDSVNEISNVSFSNVVTSITESSLVASGIIKNNSQSLSISPPWYIECQFYYQDNSGNTFLIGGESVKINNALASGISMEWTLTHQTDNPDNYSNFTINDLRAYK